MATSDVLFNPFLPEFHADPYPIYRRLREQDPMHRTALGFWILTRYDDVLTVLRDSRFGREGFAPLLEHVYGSPAEGGTPPRSMLFRDPPDHTRLRGLVSKAFTPRVIEGMRPHIQELVDRHPEVFKEFEGLPPERDTDHRIELIDPKAKPDPKAKGKPDPKKQPPGPPPVTKFTVTVGPAVPPGPAASF